MSTQWITSKSISGSCSRQRTCFSYLPVKFNIRRSPLDIKVKGRICLKTYYFYFHTPLQLEDLLSAKEIGTGLHLFYLTTTTLLSRYVNDAKSLNTYLFCKPCDEVTVLKIVVSTKSKGIIQTNRPR